MSSLTVHRYGNPDAPPVVLVHGLTDAGTAWPDVVQHWGDRWDVHAPDLRGHGRSPRFTADELARDPAFVAENEVFLDAMRDMPGQVARMSAETSWSRTEIDAWAACKPLVDREYVRRGLWLGDPAWEGLFDALEVPTMLVLPPEAPMAPDPTRFANDLVRTVVIPDSGHCVRRDQPARFHEAVDGFLAVAYA